MQNFIDLLPKVLAEPDEIRPSLYDGRVILYYQMVSRELHNPKI